MPNTKLNLSLTSPPIRLKTGDYQAEWASSISVSKQLYSFKRSSKELSAKKCQFFFIILLSFLTSPCAKDTLYQLCLKCHLKIKLLKDKAEISRFNYLFNYYKRSWSQFPQFISFCYRLR